MIQVWGATAAHTDLAPNWPTFLALPIGASVLVLRESDIDFSCTRPLDAFFPVLVVY